jgi:hypothetical protein
MRDRVAALVLVAACGGGGGDDGPSTTATAIFTGDVYPLPLQVDAQSVYFATGDSIVRQIQSVPVGGGTPTRVLPATDAEIGQRAYPAFTLHGATIYACQVGSSPRQLVAATGGTVTPLADLPADVTDCYGIVATDDAVYVTTKGDTDSLYAVAAGGGTPVRLDDADRNSKVVSDGTTAYYLGAWNGPRDTCPSSLVIGLRSASLASPTPVEVACLSSDGFYSPSLAGGILAVVDAFTNIDAFTLAPFSQVGSFTPERGAQAVVTDGSELVWARFASDGKGAVPEQPGMIRTGPIHGGTAEDLLTGLAVPMALAVDEGYVYFVDGDTISRVAR